MKILPCFLLLIGATLTAMGGDDTMVEIEVAGKRDITVSGKWKAPSEGDTTRYTQAEVKDKTAVRLVKEKSDVMVELGLSYKFVKEGDKTLNNETISKARYALELDKSLHAARHEGKFVNISKGKGGNGNNNKKKKVKKQPKELLWAINAKDFELDLDTELDGELPYDYDDDDDETGEGAKGAFIAWNRDHDLTEVTSSYQGPYYDFLMLNAQKDDNDFKRFNLNTSLLDQKGTVILRRSNGKIFVWSDRRKHYSARILGHALDSVKDGRVIKGETWKEKESGNGYQKWELPAQRAELEKLVKNGIYVEGFAPSDSLKDTVLSLEFWHRTEDGGLKMVDADRIQITVVNLHMGYWTNLTDAGNLVRDGQVVPQNSIVNPAVIVVPVRSGLAPRFRVQAKYSDGEDVFEEDDERLTWGVPGDIRRRARFTNRNQNGTEVGLSIASRVTLDSKLMVQLIGADTPYLEYHFRSKPITRFTYRVNFLFHPDGVGKGMAGSKYIECVTESDIPKAEKKALAHVNGMVQRMNVILYQAGIELVPDRTREAGEKVIEDSQWNNATVRQRRENYQGWYIGPGVWRIDVKERNKAVMIDDLDEAKSLEKVNSIAGRVNFVMAREKVADTKLGNWVARTDYHLGPQPVPIDDFYPEVTPTRDINELGLNTSILILTSRDSSRICSIFLDSIYANPRNLPNNERLPAVQNGASTMVHEFGHGIGLVHRGVDTGGSSGKQHDSTIFFSGIAPNVSKSVPAYREDKEPNAKALADYRKWQRIYAAHNLASVDERKRNIMSYHHLGADFDLTQVRIMRKFQNDRRANR